MVDRRPTRRAFILDLGKGGLAVAIFAMTTMACSDDAEPGVTISGSSDDPTPTDPPSPAAVGVTWERVNLGFVSAYVLARRGEATIVDTGIPDSEAAIETSLGVLDLEWDDVSNVIVTHLHDDHKGSLPAVLNLATAATGYAGFADIPGIPSPRELVGVGDGDSVFGLTIIDTPGHTPGHISVLDERSGLLVAGDAMTGGDGGVAGANPQFTADMATAGDSIKKLAGFSYDTVVFGHGEPVIGNASEQVAALAAQL
jgi:glyoxylase-like metal-dependent hydrolase (beta-lactamase superfamily II)